MEIELKDINKSFGKNHVLKDISFLCKSGTAFGLLGRNGSGKTTTIRIIMDIFKADKGKILFDGNESKNKNYKIGYLPEERGLYPKKNILEQMIYFGELRGLKASEAKKRSIELLEKLEASEYLKKNLETLSKGNQQKIQLAITLINDPDILILDEPFSGLDPVNAKLLKDIVREEVKKNKLVIFSSHQMANVEEFCDELCIINKGQIVLNGNLNSIKKSYSRDRIFIMSTDETSNNLDLFLKKTLDKNFIKAFTQEKNGFILKLRHENEKNSILNSIISENIDIDSFIVLEPTLEEIFIEKAGNEVE